MYLSDIDIKKYFRQGLIKVKVNGKLLEGEELEQFLKERVKGCSMDLALADDFKIHKVVGYPIDEKTPTNELFSPISSNNGIYTLNPGKTVLGRTEEFLILPNSIRGLVDGKSGKGRRRISVHDTASTVHPGFRGCLALEILNSGENSYNLRVGERIAQVLFAKLETPAEDTSGSYIDQETTQG